jgi:hypothetical protein
MATLNVADMANPILRKAALDAINGPLAIHPIPFKVFKPPKFRYNREVHAQRARKLRRRGEYVHFLRWEHGHCIYGWGGPRIETFTMRFPPKVAPIAE